MLIKNSIRTFNVWWSPDREGILIRLLFVAFYGSSGAWMPFFNVYLLEVGLLGVQVGLIASINRAVMMASQPLWGMAGDAWGRRRTLLLSLFMAVLIFPGFAFGTNFWFFFVWIILYAFLVTPIGPLVNSLALDYLDGNKRLSFGRLRIWGSFGFAAAAFLAGRAIMDRDIRLIFVFAALMSFMGWLVVRNTRHKPVAGGATGRSWNGLRVVLRNRRLLTFLALVILFQLGTSAYSAFFPVYLNELGASSQLIGLAVGVIGLSEMPLWLVGDAIIKRLGLRVTLVICFLTFAVRALLLSFLTQPVLAIFIQMLHGSTALYLTASIGFVNQQVPRQWRATGQSLFWAANYGPGVLMGALVAGFLYDYVGVQMMYRLIGGLLLSVAVAALIVLREK
jgi:PPP family 3-phenylpropionic acid transporter